MSAQLTPPDRRKVLAASAAMAASHLIPAQAQTPSSSDAIRPFKINVPEAELTELRRRINATRWPERETVTDDSQGVPLAMMQELARYYAGVLNIGYAEAGPPNGPPVILLHGWPYDIYSFVDVAPGVGVGRLSRDRAVYQRLRHDAISICRYAA
jgi:hypothetical protein